jgi:hypothetical protein
LRQRADCSGQKSANGAESSRPARTTLNRQTTTKEGTLHTEK